jgi:hypothetical protein
VYFDVDDNVLNIWNGIYACLFLTCFDIDVGDSSFFSFSGSYWVEACFGCAVFCLIGGKVCPLVRPLFTAHRAGV